MIHNGTLYWQNCSQCGARWIGTHTCDPTPRPTVRNITLPPMSKLVIGRVEAENAQLRADLAAAEAKLAALRVNPDVLDLIRQSLVIQESETIGGDWRYAYAIEFVDSLRSHSADPSSAPPPARNPATPPSGR